MRVQTLAVRGEAPVVVITGGTAGVGRATARKFAREGASVAVLARGQAGLEATCEELREMGARVMGLEVDVSEPEQVDRAALAVEHALGPIEIWINNAMVTVYGRIGDIAPEEYRRVTDVVYHGYVWGTQAALSVMQRRNRGTIVQVGSSLAYRGIPLQSAYCGAKHAIRAFTDSLRAELLHEGSSIRVTMVQLPSLNTPQFDHCLNKMDRRPQPVPPIFQPEVAADAIYAATVRHRREVFVGAPTLKLIWAQKLMPGLLDRYVARKVWPGQFTDQPARDEQSSNLFRPVECDEGAHGRFGLRARATDPLSKIMSFLGAGGVRSLLLATPLLALGFWAARRRRAEARVPARDTRHLVAGVQR